MDFIQWAEVLSLKSSTAVSKHWPESASCSSGDLEEETEGLSQRPLLNISHGEVFPGLKGISPAASCTAGTLERRCQREDTRTPPAMLPSLEGNGMLLFDSSIPSVQETQLLYASLCPFVKWGPCCVCRTTSVK